MDKETLRVKHQAELDTEVADSDERMQECLEKLQEESLNTVEMLLIHRDCADRVVSLSAAKYLAKLCGLEVERHQHDGEIGLTITSDHAERVRDAASKTRK